jgi:hypothetical protein
LILGILNDAVTRRRIHPVYIWGGMAVVIIHIIRVPLGEMNWWINIAQRIIG